MRNYIKSNFKIQENLKAINVWENIFKYRKAEYPKMCLLAKIIISLSASNSSVERAFSMLTLLLDDQRLSIHHSTLQDLLASTIQQCKIFWHPPFNTARSFGIYHSTLQDLLASTIQHCKIFWHHHSTLQDLLASTIQQCKIFCW